jgi:hypothetical protein
VTVETSEWQRGWTFVSHLKSLHTRNTVSTISQPSYCPVIVKIAGNLHPCCQLTAINYFADSPSPNSVEWFSFWFKFRYMSPLDGCAKLVFIHVFCFGLWFTSYCFSIIGWNSSVDFLGCLALRCYWSKLCRWDCWTEG